jgi:hypothetical protein
MTRCKFMTAKYGPRSFAYLAELALLVLLATLWGASYIFIKLGVASIPPVTFIAARTTIAAVVLPGVLHGRGVRMPILALMCLSIFSTALAFTIYFRPVVFVDASISRSFVERKEPHVDLDQRALVDPNATVANGRFPEV